MDIIVVDGITAAPSLWGSIHDSLATSRALVGRLRIAGVSCRRVAQFRDNSGQQPRLPVTAKRIRDYHNRKLYVGAVQVRINKVLSWSKLSTPFDPDDERIHEDKIQVP
jgi:hypothetical protein